MSVHARNEWYDELIAPLVDVFEQGVYDERGWLATGRLLEEFTILSMAADVDLVDRGELIEVWNEITPSRLFIPFSKQKTRRGDTQKTRKSEAEVHIQEWLSRHLVEHALEERTATLERFDPQTVEDLIFLRPGRAGAGGSVVLDPVFAYEANLLFSSDSRWEHFRSPRDDDEESGWSLVDGHLGHLEVLDDWCTFYLGTGLDDITSSRHSPPTEGPLGAMDTGTMVNLLAAAVRWSVGVPWMTSRLARTGPEVIDFLGAAHDAVHLPLDEAPTLEEAAFLGPQDLARGLRRWVGIRVEGWRRIDKRLARRSPQAARTVEHWIAAHTDQLPPGVVATLGQGLRERWS